MIIQFPNYTILKQEPTLDGSGTQSGRIVLVERHDEEHRPFVTAWIDETDNPYRTVSGDLEGTSALDFDTLDIATVDYFERCLFDARRAINRWEQQKAFKEMNEAMRKRQNDNLHA